MNLDLSCFVVVAMTVGLCLAIASAILGDDDDNDE